MPSRLTLIGLHLLGDALLLWLGYRWLGMDESDGSHLFASFGLIAIVIVGAAWLHGLALAHFAGLSLASAALRSLRSLIPLTLLCLLAMLIYGGLVWVDRSYSGVAFRMASFLTLHLRKPVAPALIEKLFHGFMLVLEWSLVPALLIRVGARVATTGWSGFRRMQLGIRSFWVFAVAVAAFLFLGIWVPFRLFFWIPDISNFWGQFASFVVRTGFGYLLFVFCILFLEFITVAGRPLETQPTTVA